VPSAVLPLSSHAHHLRSHADGVLVLSSDVDGKPPRYRGRVLIGFSIDRNRKDSAISISQHPCNTCPRDKAPVTGSYKVCVLCFGRAFGLLSVVLRLAMVCVRQVDIEVHEASQVEGNHKNYEVTLAWGHTLTAPEKEKHKGEH